MDESHTPDNTNVQHAADRSASLPTPQTTRVSSRRHRAPTTLIASLGMLVAMSLGVVSTATTNWSRAQSTDGAKSAPGTEFALAADSASDGLASDSFASGGAVGGGRSMARVREGTRLAQRTGRFTVAGDRLSFTPDGSSLQLVVLENLVLDRVSHALADTSDVLTWSVSGRVTEYRGANFIILDRAVVKRREPQGVSTDER